MLDHRTVWILFGLALASACHQPSSRPSRTPSRVPEDDDRQTEQDVDSEKKHTAPPPEYGHRVVRDCRDKNEPRCRYTESE
jgi:hypothetical protein